METDINNRKPDQHEAWMAINKKQAITLLKALTKLPEKQDPTIIALKKELEDIRNYWHKLETLSIKKSEIKKNKYIAEGKNLVSNNKPKALGGKAGEKLLKRKGIK